MGEIKSLLRLYLMGVLTGDKVQLLGTVPASAPRLLQAIEDLVLVNFDGV